MVLVQEMALKLDQEFLAAVIDLFTPATDPEAGKQKVVAISTWEGCFKNWGD